MTLSVIILTHNPKYIFDNQILLEIADEIIILHDSNKERLVSKSSNPKLRYLDHPLGGNFSAQRNYALKHAKGDWVLFVDSDERVTKALATEIADSIKNSSTNGYFLKRHDYFYGLPLSHGEPGAVRLLRLAKREVGRFHRPVHETWEIAGPTEVLNNSLQHLRTNLTSGFLERMIVYSPIDAKALIKEGKPFSIFRLIFFPKAKFIQNYLIRRGFLDGLLGLFHAYLMSVQSLTIRVFQWELQKRK